MRFFDLFKLPLWLAGVAGSEKSFLSNPIIGSRTLNRMGLHRGRVMLAARMAAFRRRQLALSLAEDDRRDFDRQGFLLKENFLPQEQFLRVCDEVFSHKFEAREMRQGQTVSRMIPLTKPVLVDLPGTRSFVRGQWLKDMFRYAAGVGGEPVFMIQTVIADPITGQPDPQTDLHQDTFFPSAKIWLFLHDVGEEDGPFVYVPGSHRLTPERLEWEYKNSLSAKSDARRHHALGSFRVRQDELAQLDLPPPRRIAVRANTLVVADTYGFHARSPSEKPTTRVDIYGYLRRAPFIPWTGLHYQSLPGIKGRELDWFLRLADARQKYLNGHNIWKDVGRVAADDAAHI